MPIGSSYAKGRQIGESSRQADLANTRAILNGLRTGSPMQGIVELGREKTAKEILEESKQLALRTKAMEIANVEAQQKIKAEELNMKELELNNAVNRGLTTARTGAIQYETESANRKEQESRMLNSAMQGFYTKNPEPILEYYRTFGKSGVEPESIHFAGNGQIVINFGDGKEAVFDSPREAIEKALVPAEMIRQGITGQMTEYQTKQAEQKGRGLAIDETRAKAYEKNVESLANQRSGELSDKNKLDLYDKADKAATRAYDSEVIGKDEIPQYREDYIRNASRGLSTDGEGNKETELRNDLLNNGYSEAEADAYIKRAKELGKL